MLVSRNRVISEGGQYYIVNPFGSPISVYQAKSSDSDVNFISQDDIMKTLLAKD